MPTLIQIYLFLLGIKIAATIAAALFRLRLAFMKTTDTGTQVIFSIAYFCALAAQFMSIILTDGINKVINGYNPVFITIYQFTGCAVWIFFLWGTLRTYRAHRELKRNLHIT